MLKIQSVTLTDFTRFGRYLLTGGANTLFGYGVYAGLTTLLFGRISRAYLVSAILSTIFGVTFSYLTYKIFVFKTKGNYLREYFRTYLVYGGSTLIGLVLLPLLVEVLGINPYVAPVIVIPSTVILSFWGHRHLSFKTRENTA